MSMTLSGGGERRRRGGESALRPAVLLFTAHIIGAPCGYYCTRLKCGETLPVTQHYQTDTLCVSIYQ